MQLYFYLLPVPSQITKSTELRFGGHKFTQKQPPLSPTTSDGWGDPTLPMQLESRMRNERRISGSERASPKTALANQSMAPGEVLYLYSPVIIY